MPMTRYEIRNEYTLADPELYRAADKDDPEALLEGIAMAGIVGVLRQLGDLAEFAAEIFHDLHEEVMTTAARGHGLMIRVQQLETEVPPIEKAFLSQTDHSQFFYNAGVEWHPNLQLDQNLVTQGDLPRFVMDSYEECRGPPRLFLLDKFDVAGAGACLKRYTDPSFFKVENSAMTSADVQWEKKIRKAKKKGPRWRNGETPEVFLSHAKLHQLFLDKPVENGDSNPARHAKLKRRLNGFLFDSKTGQSYMEKVLKTPSPEHKMLHEITASSPLRLPANDHNESDLEALEVRSVSPSRESVGRKRSHPPSDKEQTVLNPLMYETNDVSSNDEICEVTNSYPNTLTDGFSSTLDEETGEKDVAVPGESKKETSLTGYQSDDLASETDNYVDAPSTMDSEMDTDSEWRVRNDFSSNYIKNHSLISVENEEHLHSQLSDSQSTGDLTMSDEGNDSSKKEISSFLSSDSPRTSAEIPQSEKMSAKEFPSDDIPDIAIVDASCYKKIADEDFPVEYLPKHVVSDNTFPGNRPDFEQLDSILFIADSTPILLHSDSEGVLRNGRLRGPKSDETASTSDAEVKKTNPITDSQCFPSVSDSKSLSGDGSLRSSYLADEPNGENAPCTSNVHDVICHTADSSVAISADLLPKDEYDQEDVNQFERMSSTLKMWNVPSHSSIDNSEMISTKNSVPGKLEDEAPKLLENLPPDYTDIAHNGDNTTSVVSKGDELKDELDSEDLNVVSDGNHVSCTVEPFVGRELEETSFPNPEIVDTEEHYATSSIDNQINSETLILSLGENCPDGTQASLEAHDRDAISEEERAINETPEPGTLKSGEVMELQGTGIAVDVTPNDVLGSESSLEKIEDPAVENDGFNPCRGPTGSEVSEISLFANLKSLNEVHVLLDESASKTDQSEIALMASPVPTVSDNAIEDNLSSPVVLDKLVEEHIPCLKDSGLDELKNNKNKLSGSLWELGLLEEDTNYLSGSQRESSLVEEVDEREAAASDLHNVFCCTISSDYPRPEVSHTISNSNLDSKVECSLDFVDGTQILSPLGQSGLNRDQESLQQSVEYQASDATFLSIDCDTEETMFRERIQLPSDIDETLLREMIQLPPETEETILGERIQLLPDSEESMLGEKIQLPPDSEESMLPEKIQLPPDRIDQELLESGKVNSELSAQMPVNKHQMLAPHEHKGDNNSALSFSLVNYPPSISELPGLRNRDINVSEYSNDSLGFMFPLSNLFSETNHINLDELPPLPPLPPVQWRMRKLQHASSTREGETNKHKELFPREISPATVPTGDISSSTEEMNHSLIPIVPETTPKEESVECSSRNAEGNSMHGTIDLPPKTENEYWSPSSLEAEPIHETICLPPKIENEQWHTSSLEANSMHDTFDLPPQTENENWNSSSLEAETMLETIDLPPKIENEQRPTYNLEADSMHERIDLPTKMQNEQLHLIMPTSESEVTHPAEEDGVADGSRPVKLPRPRNPLIDDVVALDKSKLRKVTEQVRPQMQKVDERDLLLEQIRAKSFNLKPAVASRPSSQGPQTNLKVAAILEKANAIRQALAGSDEDEDNWSDS